MRNYLIATGVIALSAWGWLGQSVAAEQAVKLPPPAADTPVAATPAQQTAVFAGGCFWGVQAVFQHTDGVLNAVSGYAGGKKADADYKTVSLGRTGHAEAVQITYDPSRITYGKLLQIYFSVAHDPTQLDRQGPDTGTQYRSEVFYTTPAQKDVAQKYIAQLDGARAYPKKIVTKVNPLVEFYPAEDYHQDYATRYPSQPYIATFDLPKIANLKATMPEVWREKAVLTKARAGG